MSETITAIHQQVGVRPTTIFQQGINAIQNQVADTGKSICDVIAS